MRNLGEIRRVLGHRDFRFLWLAQSASVIGDHIVLVALALYVVSLTGSATDLGLVLAAQALPLVTLLLFGGVWADRLPRHRVMIATDLVRFALHALLAVLIFSGSVQIWELIVIEMLFGAAEAFFRRRPTACCRRRCPSRTSSRRRRSRRCPTTSRNSPGRPWRRCSSSAREPAGPSRWMQPRSW